MILFALAGLCLLGVPARGGQLRRLAEIELHAVWLGLVALAIQVVITVVVPNGDHALHAEVHIATYGLLGVFLIANRRLPGLWLVALGVLANGLAIVLNHGIMPAAASAQRMAGMSLGAGFHNSFHLAHPALQWLGDIIPVPGPLRNVLSVGDCAIFAGMFLVLTLACAPVAVPERPVSLQAGA